MRNTPASSEALKHLRWWQLTFSGLALTSLACLFVWPFLVWDHTLPIGGFYSEWSAVAWGLGSLLVAFTFTPTRYAFPLLGLLPLGACLWLLVQVLAGLALYPSTYLLSCLVLLWATALMVASRSVASHLGARPTAIVLAWMIVVGGTLNTLASVLQHWEIHTFLDRVVVSDRGASTAFGNMGQNNHLADYLGLGLASLLYLQGYAGLRKKYVALLGTWLLFGLSLTGSRSAWLYLFALAALAIVWWRRSPGQQSSVITVLALSGLPLFLALQFLLPKLPATVTSTAMERLSHSDGLVVRLPLWRHAWDMFTSHPLLGVGYQNFAWHNFLLTARDASQGPIAAEFRTGVFTQAHNLPLQWMAEWGVGGLALTLFTLYWLITRFRRFCTPEQWWGWGILSILGIHSLLEYPLDYTFFLGVFMVVAGLIEDRPVSKLSLPPRGGRLLALIVLIGACSILAIMQHEYHFLQKAYAYDPTRNPTYSRSQMGEDLRRANASGFFDPQAELYFALLPVETARPQIWPILLHFNTRNSHRSPSADLIYRQALLLSLNGQTSAASSLLQDAYRVFPDYMPTFLQGLTEFGTNQAAVSQLYREGLALDRAKMPTTPNRE